MPGFVHVDIGADDPERAGRFYNRVFGWTVTKLEGPTPYWLLKPPDGSGPGAGIARREEPWQSVIPTIGVDSADATAAAIVAQGGSIVVPTTSIPGVGLLVTFKDTEGNILAALEADAANPFAGGPRE
jgi:predicted enzyme related to lactoylglutathione lyase